MAPCTAGGRFRIMEQREEKKMKVSENGLCKISDQYFVDFESPNHVFNKHENRPYYLAIRNSNGITWLIPLSSQVDKYRRKVQAETEKYGDCLFCHIARVKGKDSAFLIGNALPVTEEYITGPFTVGGMPFVIRDKREVKALKSKLGRYLALVRGEKLRPVVDILHIERMLLNRMANQDFMI